MMYENMKISSQAISEELFAEILRGVIAEQKAEYAPEPLSIGAYENMAWTVVKRLHAAFRGVSKGACRYARSNYWKYSVESEEDEERAKASDERVLIAERLKSDSHALKDIRLTEGMEREAFRQILAEESASHQSESDKTFRMSLVADWAYYQTAAFKKSYMESVELLADAEESRIVERLERNAQ